MGRSLLAIVLIVAVGTYLLWGSATGLFHVATDATFAAWSTVRTLATHRDPAAWRSVPSPIWTAFTTLPYRWGDDGLHAVRSAMTLALVAYAAMWAVAARLLYRAIPPLPADPQGEVQLALEQLAFAAITAAALLPTVARAGWDPLGTSAGAAIVLLLLGDARAFEWEREHARARWRFSALLAAAVVLRSDARWVVPSVIAYTWPELRYAGRASFRPLVEALGLPVLVGTASAAWLGLPSASQTAASAAGWAIGMVLARRAVRGLPPHPTNRLNRWLGDTRWFAGYAGAVVGAAAATGTASPLLPVGVYAVITAVLHQSDALVRRHLRAPSTPPTELVRRDLRGWALPTAILFALSAVAEVDVDAARRREGDAAVGRALRERLPADARLTADRPAVLEYALGRPIAPRGTNGALPAGATHLVLRAGPDAGVDLDGIPFDQAKALTTLARWSFPPATATTPAGPLTVGVYALPVTPP